MHDLSNNICHRRHLADWKMCYISASYRPITLLSPVVKILEAFLLPTFTKHPKLPDHQHGFRSGRSTTTATAEIVNQISNVFKSKKPNQSILVALNLSKALDTVDHATLLNDIAESILLPSIK